MLLENKNVVIYGAGGAIGAATARAFAREGARVFLTGRNLAKVDSVAENIRSAGGRAEAAQVDALDEDAIDRHLDAGDRQGRRHRYLLQRRRHPEHHPAGRAFGGDLAVDQFSLPIATYTRVELPDRAPGGSPDGGATLGRDPDRHAGGLACRHPAPGRLRPRHGRRGGAHPEPLSRTCTPRHPRRGLRADGMPETAPSRKSSGSMPRLGITHEQFQRHHRRARTTDAGCRRSRELANVATFMASDKASAMTGTIANLSMGMLDD